MNEYITLADSSILQNAYVVKLDDNNIVIYIYDKYSFADIYAIFGDKAKTGTITTYQYGDVHTWTGYTEVLVINVAEDNIYISLRKA